MTDLIGIGINTALSPVIDILYDKMEKNGWENRALKKIGLQLSSINADHTLAIEEFLHREQLSDEDIALIGNEVGKILASYFAKINNPLNIPTNAKRLFSNIFSRSSQIPTIIIERNLAYAFEIVFLHYAEIAISLFLRLNPQHSEKYIAEELTLIRSGVDKIANHILELSANIAPTDGVFEQVRRFLSLNFSRDLIDLIGVSGKAVQLQGLLTDFFVHPKISGDNEAEGTKTPIVSDLSSALSLIENSSNIIVIQGGAGAGKTSYSRWLEQTICENSDASILPVRVVLREIVNRPTASWLSLLRERLGHNFNAICTDDILNAWRSDRKLLFIFDGFDEVPNSFRNDIEQWIIQINIAVNSAVIVTSRFLTTDNLSTKRIRPLSRSSFFEKFHIQPFDDTRIITVIKNWQANFNKLEEGKPIDNAHDLLREIKSNDAVYELSSNPLMLSTILTLRHFDGAIPVNRAELYEKYITGMLRTWPERKGVTAFDEVLDANAQRDVLQRVALNMMCSGSTHLSVDAAVALFEEELSDANLSAAGSTVIQAIKERSNLVDWPGTFSFSHKSILEFLAAEAIQRGILKEPGGETADRLWLQSNYEDSWENVQRFWSGLASEADLAKHLEAIIELGAKKLATIILVDQFDRLGHILVENLASKMFCVDSSFDEAAIVQCNDFAGLSWYYSGFLVGDLNNKGRLGWLMSKNAIDKVLLSELIGDGGYNAHLIVSTYAEDHMFSEKWLEFFQEVLDLVVQENSGCQWKGQALVRSVVGRLRSKANDALYGLTQASAVMCLETTHSSSRRIDYLDLAFGAVEKFPKAHLETTLHGKVYICLRRNEIEEEFDQVDLLLLMLGIMKTQEKRLRVLDNEELERYRFVNRKLLALIRQRMKIIKDSSTVGWIDEIRALFNKKGEQLMPLDVVRLASRVE